MKKKLLFLMLILIIFTFNVTVKAKTASLIGCQYGFMDIDTKSIAEHVSSKLSSMNYNIYKVYSPTVYLITQKPYGGSTLLDSSVIFLAGHGDSTGIAWMGCTNEKVGLSMGTLDYTTEGIQYIGIGKYSYRNTQFVMIESCNSAKGNMNITKQFVNRGAISSLGWTTEINTISAKSWNTRFWDKIKEGGSINEANDYANSAWYVSGSIKNTRIYGNGNYRLNSVFRLSNNNKKIIDNREYNYNNIEYNVDNVIGLIKKNINNNFDIRDYEVSEAHSNGKKIYDYNFTINGLHANIGYTVFTIDNKITKIYDNTKGIEISNLKRKMMNINYKDNQYYDVEEEVLKNIQ